MISESSRNFLYLTFSLPILSLSLESSWYKETALLQTPPALQLLGPNVIPLHMNVRMFITGDLGGDEGFGRDLLVEGAIDAGLLLRVVWARQATGEIADEAPI